MADNTLLNTGTGGDTIRDLARAAGTIKTQVVQLDLGGATANAEVLITAGQQTMALSVPIAIASNQTPVSTKSFDQSGVGIDSLSAGTGQNGLMVAAGATNFSVGSGNSSTVQLAAAATFTGTVETILNAQAVSILLTSDQVGTLTLTQYIDSGGTRAMPSIVIPVTAGSGVSRSFVANGNFFRLTFLNSGAAATTTLNINTYYGTLPNSTVLGNLNTSINEVNGTAFSLNQQLAAASLPIVLTAAQMTTLTPLTTITAVTGITNALPTGSNTLGSVKITDGTNVGTIKAASVASVVTDTAIVVALSPNSPMPTGALPMTYSASVNGLALAATATDVFTLTGSATKTIKITKVEVNAVQMTASQVVVVLLKRSTANTAGTSTAQTAVPYDSANVAATATVLAYTANPTTGTLVGNLFTQRVFMPGAATASDAKGLSVVFGDVGQQYIVLRGIAQVFSVNLAGVSVVGGSANISIEWMES